MWLEFDDDLLFELLLVDIKKICISASKWTVRFRFRKSGNFGK